MRNPKKVDQIMATLQSETAPHSDKWTEAQGYHSLPAVTLTSAGYNIIPDSAVVVKLFINSETGEVRPFWAIKIDDLNEIPAGKTGEERE